jgi:hypothetical protein
MLAILALVVGTGCSTVTRNPFSGSRSGDAEQIRIRIENQNFNDATVHVLRGGERIRLGVATGKADKDFRVRWNFTLPIEFEIHLVGGGGCRVRTMTVDPGDRIWVRIPTQIFGSECISGKT